MKINTLLFAALFTLLLAACQSTHKSSPSTTSSPINENQRLLKLVENYSNEGLKFNPIRATFIQAEGYNHLFFPALTTENIQAYQEFEQKYLDKAEAFAPEMLSGQALLTYQVFLRDRKLFKEGNQFPEHMIPLNQMYGVHNFFAQLGSGQSAQPFNNEKDYRDFILRSKGFAEWMDSAIETMKIGIKNNVVLPQAIAEKLLPQLKVHIVNDISQSIFYGPLNNLPKTIQEPNKTRLINDYKKTISSVIIPSYQRMYDFLSTEYLKQTRASVGLSELPNGKAWYEYKIKTHTTLDLTADEIHSFGKQEVARILAEMKKVKEQVKFQGELAQFFEFLRNDEQFYFDDAQKIIDAYTQIKTKIDATLPQLFEVFPKADYEVRAVPSFRAASAAGASYQGPAPDGSRPGIFFINTHNLKSQPKFLMETLSIHEAAPGHHFQIAIQQEVEDLPNYRKFGGYTVFSEGWALYAESLGKELGLFTDPYMWYGRLVDEQLRAMRLVVDTGLHAKGWTREQAIQFMLENSSMATSDVEAEVERYIVIPGQALAYKIGEKKIRQLRNYAADTLGDRFDIKKFHTQILIDGSLPMPVLEQKIKRWIKTQKN